MGSYEMAISRGEMCFLDTRPTEREITTSGLSPMLQASDESFSKSLGTFVSINRSLGFERILREVDR